MLVNGTAHRVLTRVDAHLQSGIDWFDLEGPAHFGDVAVPLPELLAALERDAGLGRAAGRLARVHLERHCALVADGRAARPA